MPASEKSNDGRPVDAPVGTRRARRPAPVGTIDGQRDASHAELTQLLHKHIETSTAQLTALTGRIDELLAALPSRDSTDATPITGPEDVLSRQPTAGIVIDSISKSFGSVKALHDISFKVGRGEVVALLGPNGAGKTTTVDILSTLTKPDSGYAEVAGYDVVSDPAGVRRSITVTGQHVALDEMLTGRENLIMFARLQGLKRERARSRAEELLERFDLQNAADRGVGTYSGGMRRRIDIACGLVVRPQAMFLDEPTTGLDPRSRRTIWELVSQFKEAGIATLLTTQYLEEADALADRIIVIDHGRVIAEGTADELKERCGGVYCEVVPRHLADLATLVEALNPILTNGDKAVLTPSGDRLAMPAPDGPNTLVRVLHQLSDAKIELLDVALRRPSLDEVFLTLTTANGAGSADHQVLP